MFFIYQSIDLIIAKLSHRRITCECGGYYTDAVYSGVYEMISPKERHEKTKMHPEFIKNGNVMSEKLKEKSHQQLQRKKS